MDTELYICDLISQYLQKNPELRFIQALWSLGIIDRDSCGVIVDRFYERSEATLDRILPHCISINIANDNKLYVSNPYKNEKRNICMEYAKICHHQQEKIAELENKLRLEKGKSERYENHIKNIAKSLEEFQTTISKLRKNELEEVLDIMQPRCTIMEELK